MISTQELIEKQRRNFVEFMKNNNLNPNSWARKAGVSEGTIRHYVSGRNKTITFRSLLKLAFAANCDLAEILCPLKTKLACDKQLDKKLFVRVFCAIHDFIAKNKVSLASSIIAEVTLDLYELKLKNEKLNLLRSVKKRFLDELKKNQISLTQKIT